jgi:hypothetical protein
MVAKWVMYLQQTKSTYVASKKENDTGKDHKT